ncbi:hypothetical protein [Pseudolysinimonas sp.]|uniref:hypothetical protein n=1 Tax=Pseudolysinimonas sp. TaxID=2680009 RepID=UPI003F804BD1
MIATVVYDATAPVVREVAEAIAEGLRVRYTVRCVSSREADDATIRDAGLVVLGAPTRRGTLPDVEGGLRRWIDAHHLDDHGVLVFTTRPRRRLLPDTALRALRRRARRAGGALLSAGRGFRVDPSAAQLAGVLMEARDWGRLIALGRPGWDRPD